MRIWKFEIQILGCQKIHLPKEAKILSVQEQKGKLSLWALVDEMKPFDKERTIVMYGTGHSIPDNTGRFVSTVQLYDGDLVLHVFEVT